MDNPNKLLPWPVGFELEWAAGDVGRRNPLTAAERVMRDGGFQVNNVGGWRRTPPSLTHWDLKTDSSCGYEACSPVIETFDELANACAAVHLLEGSNVAQVNRSCGLHVHLGVAPGMTPDTLEGIIKFLYRYEAAFYLLVPGHRRTNRYCKPMPANVVDIVKKKHGDVEIASIWGSKDTWVNFVPMGRTGTIEFRFLEGTLDAATIYSYCMFLSFVMDILIRGAKKGKWGRASAKDDWMLFYTMLQQCGLYGRNPFAFDKDKAVIARKWAAHRFQLFNPDAVRGKGGGSSAPPARSAPSELVWDSTASGITISTSGTAATYITSADVSSSTHDWVQVALNDENDEIEVDSPADDLAVANIQATAELLSPDTARAARGRDS